MVKSFNVSFEYALHDMSYANAMLYVAVLPDYSAKKGKESVNADDPNNKDKVRDILLGKIV